MKTTLLIRADADTLTGTGHVMRMIALGQMWRARIGRVVFVADAPDSLAERLKQEHFEILRVKRETLTPCQLLTIAEDNQAAWICFDGYSFSSADTQPLRVQGFNVLQLDDYHHQAVYDADILLNPSTTVFDSEYALPPGARVLSGPRYALLRQEFVRHPQIHREQQSGPLRVLLSMGGADPGNFTLQVLRELAHHTLRDIRLTVLLGTANTHQKEITSFCKSLPFHVEVSPPVHDMAEFLFSSVDFVISAAGSTVFEVAYAGLPMAVIQTAENQKYVLDTLQRHNAAFILDTENLSSSCAAMVNLWHDTASMQVYANNATQLVDGQGTQRIMREMQAALISFRRATEEDSPQLFAWRNAPEIRKHSRQCDPIPLECHQKWLSRVLQNPVQNLLIAYNGNAPLGVIRFDEDVCGTATEISIYLVPEKLNQGWGTPLLLAAVRWCWAHTSSRCIKAVVLPGNHASHTMFQRVGFTSVDGENYLLHRKESPHGC